MGAPLPPPVKQASLADGLAPPFAGVNTLAHIRRFVDAVVEVTEDEIRDAWWPMLDTTKMFVEPAAVVGLAAIRSGLIEVPAGRHRRARAVRREREPDRHGGAGASNSA